MTLVETRPGDEVIIKGTKACRGTRRRLWDLGLLPGTKVKTVAAHPFRGPIIIKVGECTVAVGRRLASCIQVSK